MVEIPQPPALELTEHEREVIQRNRDYQQAAQEQNEALRAAYATGKQFLDAHTKMMHARYARDQTVAGHKLHDSRGWPRPPESHRSMSDKELSVALANALPFAPTEREALLILTLALKQKPPYGGS